jgi:predicted N-formylglutamate amidohydrolase
MLSMISQTANSAARIRDGQNLAWLVVCDHASNGIPPNFAGLGLSAEELHEHIAWDVGAAHVARALSQRLGAPLIESGFSRLLIDCNRYPDAADSIAAVSDRRSVSGNRALTAHQRHERHSEIFTPYHVAIDAALSKAERLGHIPVFISIHSFVPSLNGRSRPWDIGISWTRDDRVAAPVLDRLSGVTGITVGDNQPYPLEIGIDFTTPEHAMARGLAHIQIELRQDLLSSVERAEAWAERVCDAIHRAYSAPTWHRRHRVLTSADNIKGAAHWL